MSSRFYTSSRDTRYASTKAPVQVLPPPSSYGGHYASPPPVHSSPHTYSSPYKSSSHYSSVHSSTHPTYPHSISASTPRSQSSQYSQYSQTAYTTPILSSKSYDSHDTSGYASSNSSRSSATTPPSSSHIMYPASPKRPHSCDLCALSFDRSHDLKRHRESHNGTKPFECASCTRSFTRKDALKRHQSQKQCGLEMS